jgi:ATP-dependent protease ClpP protease subunit
MKHLLTLLAFFAVSCYSTGPKPPVKKPSAVAQLPFFLQPPKKAVVPEVVCPSLGPCVAVYDLDGGVDDELTESFTAWLDKVKASKASAAIVNIDTNGGSVEAGMELIKAMESSNIPITCVVDHKAYSMGLAILQGSGCSRRLMTKRSSLMGHAVSAGGLLGGGAKFFHSIGARLDVLDRTLAEVIGARLNTGVAGYRAKVAGGSEYWLDWEEALRVSAVDATVESPRAVLEAMKAGRKL